MDFKVKFRAFKLGDEVFINKLREDEEMEKKIGGFKRFVSIDREEKWVRDVILGDSQTIFYFAVTKIESSDIIGYISISDIDYRNGTCVWGGMKLDQNEFGKGYGTQIALLTLKYIFEELRMVRCSAACQEEHTVILKIFEKVGYKREGLMRKSLFKNGKHINQWLLSAVDEDYENIKKKYNL
ncbi:hypothetical protein EZS27_013656 [termite gut metagenome]|uniref:N-acetyltransferase domain-containing protein n=1 Tax=termite gut metagenome TaxID=433724 RepID=A0A5J4RX48_9ZZZZ